MPLSGGEGLRLFLQLSLALSDRVKVTVTVELLVQELEKPLDKEAAASGPRGSLSWTQTQNQPPAGTSCPHMW